MSLATEKSPLVKGTSLPAIATISKSIPEDHSEISILGYRYNL
jgi:hypothetical protein